MSAKRHGSWIQTYSGIQFWPMDPRPDEITIEDVAHALSMLCRFNGHGRRFYSVAEHSVHVSRVVPPRHALWGLLHDASEAYLSDVPQPVKQHIPAFHTVEDKLLKAVALCFDLPEHLPKEVKEADRILLATEKLAIMAPEPAPWHNLPPPLDPAMIQCWSPEAAKLAFLERFKALQPPRAIL